ncbi:hypothetical protein BU17DRAFT_103651 [Hysterangium stoloniferum]|nr:hypothetical protein BU17DRAFT_103651 [Hysterangium stoloniferum]
MVAGRSSRQRTMDIAGRTLNSRLPPICYPSIDENLSQLLFEKVNSDVAKETHSKDVTFLIIFKVLTTLEKTVINCPTPPLFSLSSSDSDYDIPFAKRTFNPRNNVLIPSASSSSSESDKFYHFKLKRLLDNAEEGFPLKRTAIGEKDECDEDKTFRMMQVSDYD